MRKPTTICSAWACNLVLSPNLGINDKHAILASFRAEQPETGLALVALTQPHGSRCTLTK
jgi:hypothetical protein